MSLKSVELQVAIPRTQEAARVQEQLHQRPQHDQQQVSGQLQKQYETERKRPQSLQESDQRIIREDEHSSGKHSSQQQNSRQKNQTQKQKESAIHPYKGHHIDISL